ncbi:MAG: TlpA disulfide reductase family protein [Candidatus Polarisedimenticolia bacterium]
MKHAARALVAAALVIAPAAPAAAAAPEVRPIDRDGLSSLLRAQRGRVVVLNMWATWCEPCREEFPAFVALDRELRDLGVSVLAVSLDSASALETEVRPFLASQGASFSCFIKSPGDDDAFINAIDPTWSGALPATFLYDQTGRRIQAFSGTVTLERLRRAVTPLLAKP